MTYKEWKEKYNTELKDGDAIQFIDTHPLRLVPIVLDNHPYEEDTKFLVKCTNSHKFSKYTEQSFLIEEICPLALSREDEESELPSLSSPSPGEKETKELSKSEEALRFLMDLEDKTFSPGNEDNHYKAGHIDCPYCNKQIPIEPIDYIEAQQLGPHEANVVKYISRWKEKGGIKDLFKSAWYLMRLIRFVEKQKENGLN